MSPVQWFSHQYVQLHFPVRTVIVNIICCFTSQTDSPIKGKDVFNYQNISLAVVAPEDEILIPVDDLNEHVWKNSPGFEDVYESFADQLTVENTSL